MDSTIEKLYKEMLDYSEEKLESMFSTEGFDKWLFMDAGTEFGYAYNTRIMIAFPHFKYEKKKTGFDYGKLCVYEVQLHVRKNSDYTKESILNCVKNYLGSIMDDFKQQEIHETTTEYSYFV